VRTKWLYSFIVVILLLGMMPSVLSARPQAETGSIEQDLLDRLEAEGAANFFVKMTVEADLSSAYDLTDWHARGAFVYDALQEVSRSSQAPVIAYAQQHQLDFASFLTTNSVLIRGGTLEAALGLAALPGVAYLRAERIFEIPDEPEPSEVSGSEPGMQAAITDWGILDTKADQVWSQYGVKGQGITVASLDTGVDYTHIALQPNYKCGAGPHTDCWLDPGTEDCQGPGGGPCAAPGLYTAHGTHTLGTVLAVDDPTFPYIVGMAPTAQWIACLACPTGPDTCPEADTLACADWVLAPGGNPANRPNVVNNSWGQPYDPWFEPAVNAWRAAGIFPAFSAGNTGPDCGTVASPGGYQESMATAAHDSSRVIASFSGRGWSLAAHEPYTKPNISAPGVNIISTVPGDFWEARSGTSTASPHTAGAVALVWSACPAYAGKIDLTMALLMGTADAPPPGDCDAPPDGDGNYTYGYGYLNALAAVQHCLAAGQPGALQGHVLDEFGIPMLGAGLVAAPQQGGIRRQATADAAGFYSLDLEPGSYDVTVSQPGFGSMTAPGVVVSPGQTTVQDFTFVSASAWKRGTPTSFALAGFDGVYNPRDKLIYFPGGRTGATTHDRSIYTYDPATGASADTGVDMLYNTSDVTAALVNDDVTGRGEAIYVIGGRNVVAGTNLDAVQRYYPQHGLVEEVSSDPYPDAVQGVVVSAAGVEVVNDKIYVFGGWEETAAPYFSSKTWVFDPKGAAGSRWTDLGCDLSPARSFVNTAVVEGKVYAMGGVYQYVSDPVDRVPTDVAQVFDTGNPGACWQTIASLPVATAEGRGFGHESGMVYVAGGGDWPGVSAAVYAYDVAANTWGSFWSSLAQAVRDQAGVFVSDFTTEPDDAFPSLWVFGGSLGGETPPFGSPEYWPVALGQGTLHGHVTDDAGSPVAGATVTAQRQGGGGGGQVPTNANGYYRFDTITGTYDVTAAKAGYFNASASGVVVAANQTVVQDLVMDRILAPEAAFSAEPTAGLAPLTVQFSDESTGVISSWLWDFGDGTTGTAPNPTHGYLQPGSYTVSLTVSGPTGSDTLTRTAYITAYAPVHAVFSATPTWGVAPLSVSFTNTSVGDYTSSSWDLGDGTTSTEPNPGRTYTTAGQFTVSLTVSGPGGTDTLTRSNYITVYTPVQANFSGTPTSGVKPLTVAFTNTSTGDYASSKWYFGDGTTSTEQNPSHAYAYAGQYTVALTVSGPGGSNTLTRTAYITAYAPVYANFSAAPTWGVAPLNVAFTNSSVGDYTSSSWSFGDGSTSTEPNPSHTYTSAGQYTVSLTVSGPGGTNTLTRSNYITVYAPVQANFSGTPTSGVKPLAVAFANTSSGDYTTSKWYFGDGTTSTEQNPSHTYTNAGQFTVALTVSGPGGSNTLTRTGYISVVHPPPDAAFSASPTAGVAPLAVVFADESTGTISSWLWDFGDGTTGTARNPTHGYMQPGSYTVSLTVTGPGGTDTLVRSSYITAYSAVHANFGATPTWGVMPLSVALTNTSVGDYTSSSWSFGDGSTSTEPNPSHTYTTAGQYTVSLTVSGPGGTDTLTRSNCITVYTPVDASFSGVPTTGAKPLTVAFTNSSTGDYTSSYWTFGDGTSSTEQNPSHTYTARYRYAVRLTVSGPGGTDTMTRSNYINVVNGMAHVRSITLSYTHVGGKHSVSAEIKIVDGSNSAVNAATVYSTWTLPDNSSLNQTASSNISGIAQFNVQSTLAGVYKICVTDVVKTAWAYDPSQNEETCDTIVIP
jgi:PKD repeat protein